jgi:hypothetical protein
MSCLGRLYSPNPTREWSRVQNSCSLNYSDPPKTVKLPLLNITVPYFLVSYYDDLVKKGNVLQYKKNSSNLSKQQRYSLIAKGMWTNRNTTWATQSYSYTNPNTLSLKRVGTINITTDGTATVLPVTCPVVPSINNPSLPSNVAGTGNNPILPPPPPPPPEKKPVIPGGGIPSVPVDVPQSPTVIKDLGNLICNTVENECTGQTNSQPANKFFNPTTDSDVPGKIQELYWNPRIQTWYPKQRLTMNNSTDKWPVNSKFIFPIYPS